jgi:hypothetical protein
MGGAVTSAGPTQAENTSTRLQEAVRSGLPVMIPGAFEVRARRPEIQAADTGQRVAVPYEAAAADDRGRLERELEGGGAPSERTGRPLTTILARVRRSVHLIDALAFWRRPLPQSG